MRMLLGQLKNLAISNDKAKFRIPFLMDLTQFLSPFTSIMNPIAPHENPLSGWLPADTGAK